MKLIKTNLQIALYIAALLLFSACIDDSYDLSKGLNTEMQVGGDSLIVPLGKSTVYLDSMLTGEQINILKRMQDSTYAFFLNDSISMGINTIKPVSMAFNAINIAPVSTSFGNISLPEFIFNPMSSQSTMNVPQISIDSKLINPINTAYTQQFSISNSNPDATTIGPFQKISTNSFTESFQYIFPKELKHINKIMLSNTKVTMTFDKTKTNQLGLLSQNDTIREFRVDFPAEFTLSTPSGMNASIDGHSFIIRNAALTKNVNKFTASFIIENLNLTNYYQFEALLFNKTINYSINYSFRGTSDQKTTLLGQDVEYTVSMTATPVIDDCEIVTNPFQITVPNSEISINKDINNIPKDISFLSTVSFNSTANLMLQIADPNIFPFKLSGGQCLITLPQTFSYTNYPGKTITLPYSSLFGSTAIAVSGATLNKSLSDNQTTINVRDKIGYALSNLTVASETTTLKTLQGLQSKLITMSGIATGMTVKDAAFTTRRISVELAQKNTAISISKFVSADVKLLNTATMKNPVTVTLALNVTNLPTGVDSIFFDNYTISFPTWLKFAAGSLSSNNQLILNRGFKVSTGFCQTLMLEKVDFGNEGKTLSAGTFSISDNVAIGGKMYVKGTNLKASDMGTITVKPAISVGTLTLAVIEGTINPNLAPVTKTKNTNFPAFINQENTCLDLQNPMISMEIGNSLGVAINATITITPKRAGTAIPNAAVTGLIQIPAAATMGQTSLFRYLITKDANSSDQYENIVLPNLSSLFKYAPDQIDIAISPQVSGSKQIIDLYAARNKIDVKYAINLPLDLGKDFHIEHNDTIFNIKEKMAQTLNSVKEVTISGTFTNSIPLNLKYTLIPLDEKMKTISGISIENNDSVTSCNIDGSPASSNVAIKLVEKEEGAVKKVAAFRIKVCATRNTTTAGLMLKMNQYFISDIKIRIPQGVTVNTQSSN